MRRDCSPCATTILRVLRGLPRRRHPRLRLRRRRLRRAQRARRACRGALSADDHDRGPAADDSLAAAADRRPRRRPRGDARMRSVPRVVASNVAVADLEGLRPDLVVAPSTTSEKALSQAAAAGAPVYVTPDTSITEIERAITQLGLIVAEPSAARRLVRGIEQRRQRVRRRAARSLGDDGLRRPRRLHDRVGQLPDRRPDPRGTRPQRRRRRSGRASPRRRAAARPRSRGLRAAAGRRDARSSCAEGCEREQLQAVRSGPCRDESTSDCFGAGPAIGAGPRRARASASSRCVSLISAP